MFRRATLCLVLSAAIGCGRSAETEDQALAGPPPTSDAEAPAPPPASGPVQIEMKNVRLHVAEGVVLDVRALRGEMISTKRGVPPVFDDSESYTIRLDYADIGMDMASLTRLMNDHVLAYEDAPMSDVEIDIDDGQLRQKGKLEKGIPIPFSMKASVAATPDGRLRLHAESISALGVPATRLLDLLGLELDDLVSLKERRGVDVADDDIVIDPGGVLPPPVMRGRLTHAEIANGELRQVFGSAKAARPLSPPDPRANYVYFSGGSIRFGKLTMDGADLQLIDADDRDPFDFYPERYERQLIAGYSKNTPRGGLKTYMPDYSDLERNTKGTKDTKSTKDTKTGFVGERRASGGGAAGRPRPEAGSARRGDECRTTVAAFINASRRAGARRSPHPSAFGFAQAAPSGVEGRALRCFVVGTARSERPLRRQRIVNCVAAAA